MQKRSTSSSSTSVSSATAMAASATHQSAPGSPADKIGFSSGLSMQPGVAGMRNNFAMCELP